MCQQLAALQIAPKESIACCDENSILQVVMLFACLRSNILFCSLSPRYSDIEKQQYLNDAGIRHLVQINKPEVTGLNNITVNFNIELTLRSTDNHTKKITAEPIDISPTAPATITYTSGSSGLPKAAVHSYHNHFYSAKGSQQIIPLKPGDCWLASLPFNHIGGLAIVMRCIIAGASFAILNGKKTPKSNSISTEFSLFPITHASLVPTQLYRFLEHKNDSHESLTLRYLLLGGAPIKQSALEAIQAMGIDTFYSYGLTEMCSQVATKKALEPAFVKPLAYRQWKIEQGEILVKGDTLFLGYLKNNKITDATINGWFHTKDLVEQSPAGINITGRKDNMFISGGENFQPEVIESLINKYSAVKNSLIVAVDDDDLGQKAVVFVEWADVPQEAELLAYLRQQVSSIKIPKQILPWPSEQLAQHGNMTLKTNRKLFHRIASQIVDTKKPV